MILFDLIFFFFFDIINFPNHCTFALWKPIKINGVEKKKIKKNNYFLFFFKTEINQKIKNRVIIFKQIFVFTFLS